MGKLLIIGCGGVAGVAIQKCCQNSKTFSEICIASRTKEKCDALKEKLEKTTDTVITTAKVDADHVDELIALIKEYQPDAVLNVALPYQDLTIMDACLACKVDYIDTANYEPEDTDDPKWREIYEKRCKEEGFTAYFDYSWQWAYQERFREAGITALLGSGFDPGVTSVFTAYALKHYFDEIEYIDILDCNGGDRLSVCDKLQPGNQSARGIGKRFLLGERSLGGDRADGDQRECMIFRRWDKRICICFTMRRLSLWQRMCPG